MKPFFQDRSVSKSPEKMECLFSSFAADRVQSGHNFFYTGKYAHMTILDIYTHVSIGLALISAQRAKRKGVRRDLRVCGREDTYEYAYI